MRRILLWYNSSREGTRLFLGSLAAAIVFYFTALLSVWIGATLAVGGRWLLGLHAVVLIFFLTLVVLVSRSLAVLRSEQRRTLEERRDALMLAYTHMDRLESSLLRDVKTSNVTHLDLDRLVTSVMLMQRIVDASYNTFEGAFGRASAPEKRIDFEVTFMTKSYQDGKITIPASANREGRSPRSMVLRASRLDIYDNSVTATIYREERPVIHIIEDTAAERYEELYAGQKDRIKSSIVFPVLSDSNELLGTLVVHCDRAAFFRRADQPYWSDMLEVFAKRLAVAKARMDVIFALREHVGPQITLALPASPF